MAARLQRLFRQSDRQSAASGWAAFGDDFDEKNRQVDEWTARALRLRARILAAGQTHAESRSSTALLEPPVEAWYDVAACLADMAQRPDVARRGQFYETVAEAARAVAKAERNWTGCLNRDVAAVFNELEQTHNRLQQARATLRRCVTDANDKAARVLRVSENRRLQCERDATVADEAKAAQLCVVKDLLAAADAAYQRHMAALNTFVELQRAYHAKCATALQDTLDKLKGKGVQPPN